MSLPLTVCTLKKRYWLNSRGGIGTLLQIPKQERKVGWKRDYTFENLWERSAGFQFTLQGYNIMAACCTVVHYECKEVRSFSSEIWSVNLQGYLMSRWALKVRKWEHFHFVPVDAMIKPLKHFISATPLGALMSPTLLHLLQYPSSSARNANAPFVLLLCGVC